MKQLFVTTTALGLALAACGDNGNGVTVTPEPAGSNCANGGVAIDSDGTTTYVCDGADGSNGLNGSSAAAFTWTTIAADTDAQANTGYIADATSPLTLTLPATASLSPGDELRLIVQGSGAVSITPNSAQTFDYDRSQLGWRPNGAPSEEWEGLAASADGTQLVSLVDGSGIYRSTDSGVTWSMLAGSPIDDDWESISSSPDGTVLVAATWESPGIWYSTDSGTTWSQPSEDAPSNTYQTAITADGTTVFATSWSYQSPWYSTDSGATWTEFPDGPQGYWVSVATSADGSNVVFTDDDDNVYQYQAGSAAVGSGTWTLVAQLDDDWGQIASSSDGMTLVVTTDEGIIFHSSDGGSSWAIADAPALEWYWLAASSDGTTLIATAYPDDTTGGIAMSTDSGATWTQVDSSIHDWAGAAISSDGTHPYAAANGGSIFTNGNGSVLAPQTAELDLTYEGGGAFYVTRDAGVAYGPY